MLGYGRRCDCNSYHSRCDCHYLCRLPVHSGDIDLDDSVSLSDAVLLSQYLACITLLPKNVLKNCDTNLDGIVENTDSVLNLQFMTGSLSSLPFVEDGRAPFVTTAQAEPPVTTAGAATTARFTTMANATTATTRAAATTTISTTATTTTATTASARAEVVIAYLDLCPIVESDRYTGNEGDSFAYPLGQHEYTEGNTCTDGTSYDHGIEGWLARWNYANESS